AVGERIVAEESIAEGTTWPGAVQDVNVGPVAHRAGPAARLWQRGEGSPGIASRVVPVGRRDRVVATANATKAVKHAALRRDGRHVGGVLDPAVGYVLLMHDRRQDVALRIGDIHILVISVDAGAGAAIPPVAQGAARRGHGDLLVKGAVAGWLGAAKGAH